MTWICGDESETGSSLVLKVSTVTGVEFDLFLTEQVVRGILSMRRLMRLGDKLNVTSTQKDATLTPEFDRITAFIRKIESTPVDQKAMYNSPVIEGKHRVLAWAIQARTGWKGSELQQILELTVKAGRIKIAHYTTVRGIVTYYTLPEPPQAITGYQLPTDVKEEEKRIE
jgi:hypothetical protein